MFEEPLMPRNDASKLPHLYNIDFAEWINATTQLLRERRFTELDLNNLIEEIESLGKRDRRELQSRLIVLLSHLLKYVYQPEKRNNSWITTIVEQRRQILLILQDSPSGSLGMSIAIGRGWLEGQNRLSTSPRPS